jgi:peptidoglycan/LPS O-acetylase OafA/YrhL
LADAPSTLEAVPAERGPAAVRRAGPQGRTDRPRLAYVPALDGLRGAAVLAVLLYHAQLTVGENWLFKGGYLGVSTFFTLSGYLITSLLLLERDRTGRIDGPRFWSRRFRRLLPAAWVTLAAAVVYGSGVLAFIGFDAAPAQVRALRGDIIAGLAQVANWRFIVDSQSYGELFDEPSPILHFWSLAIEEQFYLLFPLLAIGLLAATKGSHRVFAGVIAGLTIVSLCLAVLFSWSNDRIYFGTDTRASELLLGALLAVVLSHHGRPQYHNPRTARPIAVVGGLSFLAMIGLWVTAGQGSAWLYDGGFTFYALLSVAVILSSMQRWGLAPVVLSWQPLVRLGRISYGVYLYHWLVYLWLDEENTGLGPWPLLVLRLAVTFGVSWLSYRYLEQPIREGQRFTSPRSLRLAPIAAVAIVIGAFAVTIDPPPPPIDFAEAEDQLQNLPIAPVDESASGEGDAIDLPPPRIAVFGDSTALMTGLGIMTWVRQQNLAVPAGGKSDLGCGIGRGGQRRTTPFDAHRTDPECDQWTTTWAKAIDNGQPDLAVIQIGPWEVAERKLPDDDTWRTIGDPVYDDFLRNEMIEAIDVLSADGATVVWLTAPLINPGVDGDAISLRGDAADPSRMIRLNELIAEAVAQRPDQAVVVDLAAHVYDLGEDEDIRLRPDGVHFSIEAAAEVTYDWLGPTLLEIYEERAGGDGQGDRERASN